jgi:hypothetical protein
VLHDPTELDRQRRFLGQVAGWRRSPRASPRWLSGLSDGGRRQGRARRHRGNHSHHLRLRERSATGDATIAGGNSKGAIEVPEQETTNDEYANGRRHRDTSWKTSGTRCSPGAPFGVPR